MPTSRLALIGCGAVAASYLRALRQLRLRPTIFVDSDIAAARRLARGAAVAATPAAAFDLFDAAIVTGIGAGNTDALLELARAAKPVLCAPEAMAAAVRTGAHPALTGSCPGSFAGSHLRFAPGAQQLRSLLDAGSLGALESFDVRFGEPPPAAAGSPDYWDRTVAGGGVLIDPGMHLLDLLSWWLGPLAPGALFDDSDGGVEAEAFARIATAGGVSGVLELSRLRPLRNSVVITGTKGHVELDLDTLALRPEPPAPADERQTRVEGRARGVRSVEHLQRRRIERWLAASPSDPSSAPEVLANRNALETLIGLYGKRKRLVHAWERPAARAPGIPARAAGLAGRAVLVAGGTGFIGARLVEKLVLHGARVTVAVRNLKRAARIARFDIRLCQVDLGGARDASAVTRGHEIVFGLAYDVRRSGADNLAVHRNLAHACAQTGVRHFVHLSSIAVYDDWPSGELDENSPRDAPGSEYKTAKRAMERDLGERAAAGTLTSTILQPTIVYGPFSTLWTDRFVLQLRAGTVVLPHDGPGHCSGVHVDDVVDAVIAAAMAIDARGEAYIISGARPFGWAALLGGYAEALGHALAYSEAPEDATGAKPRSLLKAIRNDPLAIANWRPARRLLAFLRATIGEERVERLRARVVALRGRGGAAIYRPADDDPQLFLAKGVCSIAKAQRDLNFAPAFELEEGLIRTRDYIRWRYLGTPVDTDGR
jgi:nucleoside-diphosphate-sugar epimerase/predicted dehydrogenase